MSDIPNTDSSIVSTYAIRWEITKHAVLGQKDFNDADIEKRIDMLIYGFAKSLDLHKGHQALNNPFTK